MKCFGMLIRVSFSSYMDGASPSELSTQYTAYVGRMPPLPDWIHRGAIIGMQGGSERLNVLHERLSDAGSAIAGYWLQDWVGQRKTSIGWQLWWNWELDRTHYPTWEDDRKSLETQGIKLLANPFLADVSTKGACERDLLTEARNLGFWCAQKDTPYAVLTLPFLPICSI